MQKIFDLRFIQRKSRYAGRKGVDSYQESLNKLGKEQLKTLLRKGLWITPSL